MNTPQKITPQRVFDAAWQAFIIEDRPPAFDKDAGRCRYLTRDGRKCAIGLLVPDGHRVQRSTMAADIELQRENPDIFDEPKPLPGYLRDTVLRELQYELHDGLAKSTGEWAFPQSERRDRYRAIATKFNLTIPGDR